MRKLLVFALLLGFCLPLCAQTLSGLEYFYDTDPGIGNGTRITLGNRQQIDSTFSFDVSGLSDGLHTIYVRALDNSAKWSINYSSAFLKLPGDASSLTITRLEYYTDSDPGFGKGTAVPITAAPLLDGVYDFPIPDNGDSVSHLFIRAQDSYGRWSLLYDTTINLCAIYKARPSFSWVRFGDEFSFIDSTATLKPLACCR